MFNKVLTICLGLMIIPLFHFKGGRDRAKTPKETKIMNETKYLTATQFKQAQRLVAKVCCNYINGDCLLLNWRTCPQTITHSVCCKYFRDVVLKDKECLSLNYELYPTTDVKFCTVCGKPFKAKSNRAKYCPDCSVKVRKQKQSEYVEKCRRL